MSVSSFSKPLFIRDILVVYILYLVKRWNIETIEITKQHGTVSIPGAYTPTEIVTAYSNGGDIIKIFPASNADYIKALHGPLSHIPMMPTGGINIENIKEFQKTGAVAFGIGTALVDTKHKITGEYLEIVTENARKFVQAISWLNDQIKK